MKPNEGLSTPVVFRHLDYDELSRVEPTHLLKQFVEEGLAEAEYVNDLELPAFKAMPSLQKMKAELEVCLCVVDYYSQIALSRKVEHTRKSGKKLNHAKHGGRFGALQE